MKNFLKWLWRYKVTTLLCIVSIEFLVAHLITGKDFTVAIIIPIAYALVSIRERGLLTDKMDEGIRDPDLREFFGLPIKGYVKRPETGFALVINSVIFMGTLGLLVVGFLTLIDVI